MDQSMRMVIIAGVLMLALLDRRHRRRSAPIRRLALGRRPTSRARRASSCNGGSGAVARAACEASSDLPHPARPTRPPAVDLERQLAALELLGLDPEQLVAPPLHGRARRARPPRQGAPGRRRRRSGAAPPCCAPRSLQQHAQQVDDRHLLGRQRQAGAHVRHGLGIARQPALDHLDDLPGARRLGEALAQRAQMRRAERAPSARGWRCRRAPRRAGCGCAARPAPGRPARARPRARSAPPAPCGS